MWSHKVYNVWLAIILIMQDIVNADIPIKDYSYNTTISESTRLMMKSRRLKRACAGGSCGRGGYGSTGNFLMDMTNGLARLLPPAFMPHIRRKRFGFGCCM